MRVCIQKSTGLLLESQTGGEGQTDLDVLVKNVSASHPNIPADDIDARYVEESEFYTLLSKTREAALTYGERRRASYPPAADYLDGLVKRDIVQMQAYIDACKKVKEKYPKQ